MASDSLRKAAAYWARRRWVWLARLSLMALLATALYAAHQVGYSTGMRAATTQLQPDSTELRSSTELSQEGAVSGSLSKLWRQIHPAASSPSADTEAPTKVAAPLVRLSDPPLCTARATVDECAPPCPLALAALQSDDAASVAAAHTDACLQSFNQLYLADLRTKASTFSLTHPFSNACVRPLVLFPAEARPADFTPERFYSADTLPAPVQAFVQGERAKKQGCAGCQEMLDIPLMVLERLGPASAPATSVGGGGPASPPTAQPRFYLEIGALDGLDGSNTLLLDRFFGWSGLLVEANPVNFASLLGNRPHAHRLESALCPADGPTDLAFMGDYGGSVGAAEVYEKTQSKEAFHGERTDTYRVPCSPLQQWLDELEVKRVHFFSLDVEGSELSVLRSLDFARIKVDILVVEMNPVFGAQELDAIREYLRNNHMQFDSMLGKLNEIWVSEE